MDNTHKGNLFGLGGEDILMPSYCEQSYLASLGTGASGLTLVVKVSKEGTFYCCPPWLEISASSDNDLYKLDAGKDYQSINFDNNWAITGYGSDKPWSSSEGTYRGAKLMTLDDYLLYFGRRTYTLLDVISLSDTEIRQIFDLVDSFALQNYTSYLFNSQQYQNIESKVDKDRCLVFVENTESLTLIQNSNRSINRFYLNRHFLENEDSFKRLSELINENAHLSIELNIKKSQNLSQTFPKLASVQHLITIHSNSVPTLLDCLGHSSEVFGDNFKGDKFNKKHWAAGYSHSNQDTKIYQKNGIHIDIKGGGEYSGAAIICTIPILDRFDSSVEFQVDNPKQGTTFELAAICIDPGYHHPENDDLNSRNVNMTFDVHGTPPYASSERDEDNGFRCGWNNGFNLLKIEKDWKASSVNMFNKYGKDIGDGRPENPTGSIRLVRNNDVFVSFYKDKHNSSWVCSGAMIVPNITKQVFLRLAAKHWKKGGNPCPWNKVIFKNFKLIQFR